MRKIERKQLGTRPEELSALKLRVPDRTIRIIKSRAARAGQKIGEWLAEVIDRVDEVPLDEPNTKA